MRAQFVVSETLTGLRRNVTLSIAVVVTVAVSLALLATAGLIRQQISLMKDFWYDRVEVSVFLDKNVTAEQRQEIENDLRALPEVDEVYYESKDEALERAQDQFKGQPALLENLTAEALPESFRVKMDDPEEYEIVVTGFSERAGVEQVVNQREVLERFFGILNAVQFGALVLALIQLAATLLLIYNMIRVAAFNRRRETGIMRLVGASNLYIQAPFLLEGAIAGFVGALLALGIVAAIKAWLIDTRIKPKLDFTSFIGWDAVWGMVPMMFAIGVLSAVLASFITLRRYLRV
jgi:cell division transport system permease protein